MVFGLVKLFKGFVGGGGSGCDSCENRKRSCCSSPQNEDGVKSPKRQRTCCNCKNSEEKSEDKKCGHEGCTGKQENGNASKDQSGESSANVSSNISTPPENMLKQLESVLKDVQGTKLLLEQALASVSTKQSNTNENPTVAEPEKPATTETNQTPPTEKPAQPTTEPKPKPAEKPSTAPADPSKTETANPTSDPTPAAPATSETTSTETKNPENPEKPEEAPKPTELETEIKIDPSIHLYSLPDLETQVEYFREKLLFPFVSRDSFISAGIKIERGLLLCGPSFECNQLIQGFANEIAKISGKPVRAFTRRRTDAFGKYGSGGTEFLKKLFKSVEEAMKDGGPIIVYFEEMQTLLHWCDILKDFAKEVATEMQKGMTKAFNDSEKEGNLFVFGVVDELHKVPVMLRESGVFGKEFRFAQEEGEAKRVSVLRQAVEKWKVQPGIEVLKNVASKTEGLDANQIRSLAKLALEQSIVSLVSGKEDDCCNKCRFDPQNLKVDSEALSKALPSESDWDKAIEMIREKIAKDKEEAVKRDRYSFYASLKSPDVEKTRPEEGLNFSSVGGLDEQISYLKENIIMPLEKQEKLKEWGVQPVKGIIFYGPPGTGKTLLAKALVNELSDSYNNGKIQFADKDSKTQTKTSKEAPKRFSYFYQKATDCFNKYVGETESNLRSLFSRAEAAAPAVIFFDEFDGLCSTRNESKDIKFYSNVVTTILGLMDNVKRGRLLVIAATNRLDALDPAIRRAGRFDRSVGFPMPNSGGRKTILGIHTKGWKQGNDEEVLEEIAEKAVGYSGADLEQLARQTFVMAMRRFAKTADEPNAVLEVLKEDWHSAFSLTKGSGSSVEAFGGAGMVLKKPTAGVDILLEENLLQLKKKLDPIFNEIRTNMTGSNNSTALHSFLISSKDRVAEIEAYLVPLLVTTSKNLQAYKLDLSDVENFTRAKVASTIAQVLNPPDGKIGVLFIPEIDKFVKILATGTIRLQDVNFLQFVGSQLLKMRGENVLTIATSSTSIEEMSKDEKYSDFKDILNDVDGSKSHNYLEPGQNQVEAFFNRCPLKEIGSLQKVVNIGIGKEINFLLDLYDEISRVLSFNKGELEKDSELMAKLNVEVDKVLKHYENKNCKQTGRMGFDMYI